MEGGIEGGDEGGKDIEKGEGTRERASDGGRTEGMEGSEVCLLGREGGRERGRERGREKGTNSLTSYKITTTLKNSLNVR